MLLLLPQMPGTELQGLEFAPIAFSLAVIQPFLSLPPFFSHGTAYSIPLNTGNMQRGFSGDNDEETVLSFMRVFEQYWYG